MKGFKGTILESDSSVTESETDSESESKAQSETESDSESDTEPKTESVALSAEIADNVEVAGVHGTNNSDRKSQGNNQGGTAVRKSGMARKQKYDEIREFQLLYINATNVMLATGLD
jgi:hypothetical protein